MPPPAPTNLFLGAGGLMARPYKCICRGGWGPGPPQQIIFKIIQEIQLIEIDLQNSLKNDKFLSQAFDEVNNTSKI